MSISLELRGICREYVKDNESFLAVDNVNLTVSPGEFLTFLGPSGCGKTTTLRMIAGFEIPSSGRIIVDGSDITQVPANKRDMGFVFQNYALFPHMTIFENVAYGLRIRGLSGDALASKGAKVWRWSAWGTPSSAIPISSRAANSSAWRSRACWC
ncbi:ABC transporter ATP-binding protein [Sutterella wadsworthensis]|uniref:ABC transporter ATP-binding protein n=1 Tax=Sutterella wadsworthensis TaxID=40545 RepID=UPI0039672D75